MKTRVHNRHAALRIFAGLLFVFMMANATVANASPPDPDPGNWTDQGYIGSNIESGSGTSTDPYLITSAAQLAYFAQQVNAGATTLKVNNSDVNNLTAGFPNTYFKLSDNVNIDLSEHYWTPIGKTLKPFKGIFDGNGRTVSGLKIKIESTTDIVYAGLFGLVQDGTIQNLGVKLDKEGIVVSSTQQQVYAGGIVGYLSDNSIIRNCYVEAENDGMVKITGTGGNANANAGGIAGEAVSSIGDKTVTITHCYATVNVEATAGNNSYVGGIVGDFERGTLSYTYATGKIEAKVNGAGKKYAGGICGYLSVNVSNLKNCLALNEEVNGGRCARIIGYKYNGTVSSNYANPAMKVGEDGKTVADEATGNNGTSTWVDKLKDDLTKAGSEWGTAWDWDTNTDALPQLKKVTGVDADGNPTYSQTEVLSGQTTRLLSETPLTQSPWSYNVADKIENSGTGDGTSGKPILIKDANELAYFAQQVNAGEKLTVGNSDIEFKNYKKYSFALSADIDLSGHDWTPIGIDALDNNIFQGHFDGKGHVVKGLRIKKTDATGAVPAGLFGRLADGTIQNLGVRLAKEGIEVSSATSTAHAGGIAGVMIASGANATIRNCYVEAENGGAVKVTGTGAKFSAFAGGIIGQAYSSNSNYIPSITHCYTTVNVETTVSETSYSSAGGIVGDFSGLLSYSYATGKIEAKGNGTKYAGGICGFISINATLTNSLALNEEVSGSGGSCGRIAGYNDNPLSSNYANPAMTINGQPVADDATGTNGTSTYLDTFVNDLKNATDPNAATPNAWNSDNWEWAASPSTKLPTLKVVTTDANGNETGHSPWLSNPAQTAIDVATNQLLSNQPLLHIKQPTEGGTLEVKATITAPSGSTNETTLNDGDPVRPGTTLKLSATKSGNYEFATFLTGNSEAALTDYARDEIAMPAADLWVSVRFRTPAPVEPEQPVEPEPKVYHTVTLPAVEGATTDPAPGDYEVEAWDTFRFYLTLDEAYNLSTPIVTTNRGETLSPRTSDGAYLVKYVRSDVEIFIEGIEPNNPVGNEAVVSVSAPRIWSADGTLHIRTDAPTDVRIYTFDGSLRHAFRSDGGEQTLTLPAGSYIVVVGEVRYKVML